jgi:hypothetical protein
MHCCPSQIIGCAQRYRNIEGANSWSGALIGVRLIGYVGYDPSTASNMAIKRKLQLSLIAEKLLYSNTGGGIHVQ